MKKLQLQNITLLGIDCVNVERLQVAMDISEKEIKFGAVKLITSLSNSSTHSVTIPHIYNIEDFSKFCVADLCKYVDTDYVLLVQYDGFVLNHDSWTREFLKYDYIGAPWDVGSWKTDYFPEQMNGQLVVGNGGFSLRSKKFLEVSARLFSEGKIVKFHPEDIAMCVWYRNLFEREGIKFAPPELASMFSVESKTNDYGKPFGFHGIYSKNMEALKTMHPDFPFRIYFPRFRKKIFKIVNQLDKDLIFEEKYFFESFMKDTDKYFSNADDLIKLENMIKNMLKIANEKQKSTLNEIISFIHFLLV